MDLGYTTVASGGQNRSSVTERREFFKSAFRSMRKLSARQLHNVRRNKSKESLPRPTQDVEPLKLGQRIVFRSYGRVPVKPLVAFHRLIKNDQIRASKLVSILTKGKPTKGHNIELLCAIRSSFEEKLKTTAQLTRIFPPDPDITRRTQELFEQFYMVHGIPNDAESELLQAVGSVDAEVVDAWFTLKIFRLRDYLKVKQMLHKAIFKAHLEELFSRGLSGAAPNIAKPYSRH